MSRSIRFQLVILCAAFFVPLGVTLVLLVRAEHHNIEFAAMELRGNAYERALKDLLVASVGVSRSTSSLPPAAIEAGERALTKVRHEDALHGEALQFTEAGLGLRNRERYTAANLIELWLHLISAEPSARGEIGRKLEQHVRAMMTHAGDTSNLILDPDLDSYYLMDATLLALPMLESRISSLIAVRSDAAANTDLLLYALADDAARIRASIRTAFVEDPNFYGTSETLRRRLTPKLEALERDLEALKLAIRTNSSVDAAGLAALETARVLHDAALDEEDVLLSIRVTSLWSSLYRGLLLAALSVLLASAIAYWIGRRILGRVTKLKVATDNVASGRLDTRIGELGRDELGLLAASFDAMTASIERLTSEAEERKNELIHMNDGLEDAVVARTKELAARNESISLILKNMSDGIFTMDLEGRISLERSEHIDEWFGNPAPGTPLPDLLRNEAPRFARQLELFLPEVATSSLPLEIVLAQLPKEVAFRERTFSFRYRPVRERQLLAKLLVIVVDETAERAARADSAEQQETLRIFQTLRTDRAGFLDFLAEGRELVAAIAQGLQDDNPLVARQIHTLKGTSAIFGVLRLSHYCHEIETALLDGSLIVDSAVAGLFENWNRLNTVVSQLTDANRTAVEIDDEEYRGLLHSIASGDSREELLVKIARWKLDSTDRWLKRLAEQARSIASRLGKQINVTTRSNNVRVNQETWAPVWHVLTHVIRNAVDHGVEGPRDRNEAHKSETGQLVLETHSDARYVYVEVRDDGKGIDWEAVRLKATSSNLPASTHGDLIEALFADGISTKNEVTNLSGRGVGLGAVRQTCRELGGDIELESAKGLGTTFRCRFPLATMESGHALFVSDLPILDSRRPAPAPSEPATASFGGR